MDSGKGSGRSLKIYTREWRDLVYFKKMPVAVAENRLETGRLQDRLSWDESGRWRWRKTGFERYLEREMAGLGPQVRRRPAAHDLRAQRCSQQRRESLNEKVWTSVSTTLHLVLPFPLHCLSALWSRLSSSISSLLPWGFSLIWERIYTFLLFPGHANLC